MANFEQVEKKLQELGQTHLLQFYGTFSDEEKTKFLQHLQNLDLEETMAVYQRAKQVLADAPEMGLMKPVPESQFEAQERCDPAVLEAYRKVGLEAVSRGEVGVLLMAGGQGTRLGVNQPKGMYCVGLPSKKSLFQIQAERIQRVQDLARNLTGKSGKITWYIMTSGPTDQMTDEYLRKHKFFGLNPQDVVQFKQGLLPCFDFNGKIILEAKNRVALAPDGNGGIYRALWKNGLLEDMKNRGVKYVHTHSVDNILIKVADPVFIGYCITKGSDCGAKVVKKTHPTEPVGVVCKIGERFQVVEYSEISPELASLRDARGDLVYSAGSICNHFFTAQFLCRVVDKFETSLKLHVAKKRIPFVGDGGVVCTPDTPNGIKIEKFVFDVFQFSDQFVTWEVPRKTEFSGMKNSDSAGIDCPKTARQDLLALHRMYIEKAGGVVKDDADVEISPLLSYEGEELEGIVGGRIFESTTHLASPQEQKTGNSINGHA